MERFWDLPGPSRFIDRLARDVHAGKSAIVALPQGAPLRIREATQQHLVSLGEWRQWRPLDLAHVEHANDPIQLLHDRFAVGHEPVDPDERTLVETDSFKRLCIWVDGLDAITWPKWRDFLQRYEHACRNVSEADRTVFLVVLSGRLADSTPSEAVALAVRRWKGVVERLDMSSYLWELLVDRGLEPLHRKLMVWVGVELAGTDPFLGAEIAERELAEVLDPGPFLREVAAKRGWTAASTRTSSWSLGMLDDFDGARDHPHSALLAIGGKSSELDRRVWRGQLPVLFPHIEEQRLRLVNELKPFLNCFRGDVFELEIGEIWAQIARHPRVSPQTHVQISQLRDMRNALAHLEPVRADRLPRGGSSRDAN